MKMGADFQKTAKNPANQGNLWQIEEEKQNDKSFIHLPRQEANKTLKHLKYHGFQGNIIEIYPHFTTFDNYEIAQ